MLLTNINNDNYKYIYEDYDELKNIKDRLEDMRIINNLDFHIFLVFTSAPFHNIDESG